MAILDNELLKLARNFTGLNQKEFAQKMNISQSLVSKIEQSLKPLSDDIVSQLKNEFGESFFYQKNKQPQLKVYYRASATVAKKYTDLFEARLQIISNNVVTMLDRIDIPENNIPVKDLEEYGYEPDHLALEMRDYFNLGRKPIQNLVKLLEQNGVIVYFFDYDFISAQNKNFDGVSFYIGGVPVILINNKIQNARKLFTLAHELGHLIMHNHNTIFLAKDRDFEKEANQFASEFLAPKISLRGEFSRVTIEKLFYLKAYWKVSAGALLYKAKEMVLTQDQYKKLLIKMAPYRVNEPNDFEIEQPVLLRTMFKVFKETLEPNEDFYEAVGLSQKMHDDIYSNIIENKKSKMKIII